MAQITNILLDPYVFVGGNPLEDPERSAQPPIRHVTREAGLQPIYEALNHNAPEGHKSVTMIEACYPSGLPGRDVIYADEEGRMFEEMTPLAWLCVDGFQHPIGGRALICGTDAEGNDTDCETTVDWCIEHVEFGVGDRCFKLQRGADGKTIDVMERHVPGMHCLDQWGLENRIVNQREAAAMGLATYGDFYEGNTDTEETWRRTRHD